MDKVDELLDQEARKANELAHVRMQFDLMQTELELATAFNNAVENGRQNIITLLIAAWALIVPTITFIFKELHGESSLFYIALTFVFSVGLVFNTLTLLRLLINVRNMSFSNMRVYLARRYFQEKGIITEYQFAANIYEIDNSNSPEKYCTSFTPKTRLALEAFVVLNSIIAGLVVGFGYAVLLFNPLISSILGFMSVFVYCYTGLWYTGRYAENVSGFIEAKVKFGELALTAIDDR